MRMVPGMRRPSSREWTCARMDYRSSSKTSKAFPWIESWGRWSDANLRRNVIIRFTDPLPRAFTLMLRGQAFGPNSEQPVRIRIGRETETITLSSNMEDKHVRFDLGDRAEREIEITPPVPGRPEGPLCQP